jgi:putative transcriptional regulator
MYKTITLSDISSTAQIDTATRDGKLEGTAMTNTPKAKSRLLEAVHETATDLHQLGFIDKRRMQKYDVLCLSPVPEFDAAHIRALRENLSLSQAVLAAVLNMSLSTVRQWENGDKKPSGSSQKLLHLIESKGLEVVL